MSLSDVVEHELLQDFVTRYSALYLAASTTDPGEDGSGITEPGDPVYVRATVGATTLTGSNLTNDSPVVFVTASQVWGSIAYIAVFSALSGGIYLGRAEIAPLIIGQNCRIIIPSGTPIVSMD